MYRSLSPGRILQRHRCLVTLPRSDLPEPLYMGDGHRLTPVSRTSLRAERHANTQASTSTTELQPPGAQGSIPSAHCLTQANLTLQTKHFEADGQCNVRKAAYIHMPDPPVTESVVHTRPAIRNSSRAMSQHHAHWPKLRLRNGPPLQVFCMLQMHLRTL